MDKIGVFDCKGDGQLNLEFQKQWAEVCLMLRRDIVADTPPPSQVAPRNATRAALILAANVVR